MARYKSKSNFVLLFYNFLAVGSFYNVLIDWNALFRAKSGGE